MNCNHDVIICIAYISSKTVFSILAAFDVILLVASYTMFHLQDTGFRKEGSTKQANAIPIDAP